MKLTISLLVVSFATAEAGVWSNLRRRLSFDKVATYSTGSQVSSFLHHLLCLSILWYRRNNIQRSHDIH